MKKYDLEKGKKIIADHFDDLEEACFGMHEDWNWTAETIWRDGKLSIENLNEDGEPLIGGISGSTWATPTISLRLKDGTEKFLPCFKGESCDSKPSFMGIGPFSSPGQENIPALSEEKA